MRKTCSFARRSRIDLSFSSGLVLIVFDFSLGCSVKCHARLELETGRVVLNHALTMLLTCSLSIVTGKIQLFFSLPAQPAADGCTQLLRVL
jgi:hypothetical protein